MNEISTDAERLVREEAPGFVAAVKHALRESKKRRETVPILQSLDAFDDDPMRLYACLWFAYAKGVSVMFVPRPLP